MSDTPAAVGRYQVYAEVGVGGFATVYRAYDPALDRDVAIKVLHPHLARDLQIRERFVREGRALARVRHPNMVQVYDAGEADGRAYLAMEYVPGRSLAERVRGRRATAAELLPVVHQVAGALDAVHSAGLIHRDIKPANILVTDDGRAVLLDLGIARSTDDTGLTTTGLLIGTPGYLAPEQVAGTAPTGPATDVYQLGATVYAVLAGRPPFEGDTAQVLYAVAHRAPPDLASVRPDLPSHVVAAVMQALAKEPGGRPSRAIDFAAALEGAPLAALPMAGGGQSATLTFAGTPAAAMPSATPQSPDTAPATALSPTDAPTLAGPPAARPSDSADLTRLRPVGDAGSSPGSPPARPQRRLWPLAVAGAALVLVGAGATFALSRGDDDTLATLGKPSATATTTAAPSPAGSRTPTPSPTQATTRTATATAAPSRTATGTLGTAAPGRLRLPTDPARQVPVPADLSPPERAVLELLNRNSNAYIAAVRSGVEAPLRAVFTGEALDDYSEIVDRLRSAGRYEVAELVTISLTEFRIEEGGHASARTVERWKSAVFERNGDRRVGGAETVYSEEYSFVRIDGRWFIDENTYTVVSRTTN